MRSLTHGTPEINGLMCFSFPVHHTAFPNHSQHADPSKPHLTHVTVVSTRSTAFSNLNHLLLHLLPWQSFELADACTHKAPLPPCRSIFSTPHHFAQKYCGLYCATHLVFWYVFPSSPIPSPLPHLSHPSPPTQHAWLAPYLNHGRHADVVQYSLSDHRIRTLSTFLVRLFLPGPLPLPWAHTIRSATLLSLSSMTSSSSTTDADGTQQLHQVQHTQSTSTALV